MRARVWLPALLLVAAVVAAPVRADEPPAAAAAGPKIAVEPPTFDFGEALPEKTLTKEFAIRNFGNQDLVIENVSTSCGCTAALLSEKDKVIRPGGTASLKVQLQTRSAQGVIQKAVIIRSNDPKSPYELKLQARVAAPTR